jgi:hypothetical protein
MKKLLFFLPLALLSLFSEGKLFYEIKALNGTYQGHSANVDYYTISSDGYLQLTAVKYSTMGSWDSTTVDWYLNNVYQFTQGDVVEFSQSGLIYFQIGSDHSMNSIQLNVITGISNVTSAALPFPFSQLSNINLSNLRYTIFGTNGKAIEQGIFSGKIILRDERPKNPLHPGIYFVIYSDVMDNRQVLTDKVFVTNQ